MTALQLVEGGDGPRGEPVAADLVAREPVAIRQEHPLAAPREVDGGGAAGRARADHDDVVAALGRMVRIACDHPSPEPASSR